MTKNNYRVYNGKAIKEFLDNSGVFLLLLFFVSGLVFGSVSIKTVDSNIIGKIKALTESYISVRATQNIVENFCNLLIINIVPLALNILFAFFAIGYPFIISILFIKGTGVGMIFGFLYMNYGIKGFGYTALTVIPGITITIIALIFACEKSCMFSNNIYKRAIKNIGQIEKGDISVYFFKQIIYILITLCGSFTEAVFNSLFSGLIKI